MVATATNIVEIEAADPQGRRLYFLPLQRRLRGEFNYNMPAEPLAKMHINRIPETVPGQRLALDVDSATAWISEPLREPEHAVLAEKLRDRYKCTFAPEREELKDVDVPTFLYWMRRAVESGSARLVRGELPEKINGEPRKSFFSNASEDSSTKLADAIEKQTTVLTQLVRMLAKQQRQSS